MAGFATDRFRDTFLFCQTAIEPTVYATGSVGGLAIPLAGQTCPAKKFVLIGQPGSGAATTQWNFWWGGASASGGTYSMIPSASTPIVSGSANYSASATGISAQSGSVYGSAGVLVVEIREEAIANLNSGITWIRPIMSVTGASGIGAVLAMGFVCDYEPASLYDQPLGAVIAESDAF